METVIDIFLHTPKYLDMILENYSGWAYAILFLIIFCETGLVVTPFLPGDSLLFAVGAIAATTSYINPLLMWFLLFLAAILGDTVNYEIGKLMRVKVLNKEKIAFVKPEHIEKTQKFFDRHGGKTITIARFIPIVRTFAPFVSGTASMKYSKFIKYNLIGGFLWVTIMFGIGYFFGNIPFVQKNFSFVAIGIIVISVIPMVVAYIQEKANNRKKKSS